jgi:hypothetical protein
MNHAELVDWLDENSGPILRYRVAVDLKDASRTERTRLFRQASATAEARYWLDCLGRARNIHGSQDTDAENALAKLLDYGFDASVPTFAGSIRHLLERPYRIWEPLVLFPFLLRARVEGDPRLRDWLENRLEKLYQTARHGSYDFYLNPDEAALVPKAWRGKPIYRDEYGHQAEYPLPTCYDLYALAYGLYTIDSTDVYTKCEAIVAFLSDERFQSTVGGYGWDKTKRRCYAAGRVFLACVMPARLVLFLELGARFAAARRSHWLQEGLAALDQYRTARGTWRFPPGLLLESTGTHLYGGSHMGLGENRRSRLALELESTFHMLYIQKRMHDG